MEYFAGDLSCPKTACQAASTMRVANTSTPVAAGSARITAPIRSGVAVRTDRRARTTSFQHSRLQAGQPQLAGNGSPRDAADDQYIILHISLHPPGSLLSAMQLHKKLPDAGRGPIRQKQISSFSFLSSGLTRTLASPAAGFSDRFSECVSPSQAVAFRCTPGYHRSGQTIPDDPGSCRHPPFYRTMAGLKA